MWLSRRDGLSQLIREQLSVAATLDEGVFGGVKVTLGWIGQVGLVSGCRGTLTGRAGSEEEGGA